MDSVLHFWHVVRFRIEFSERQIKAHAAGGCVKCLMEMVFPPLGLFSYSAAEMRSAALTTTEPKVLFSALCWRWKGAATATLLAAALFSFHCTPVRSKSEKQTSNLSHQLKHSSHIAKNLRLLGLLARRLKSQRAPKQIYIFACLVCDLLHPSGTRAAAALYDTNAAVLFYCRPRWVRVLGISSWPWQRP